MENATHFVTGPYPKCRRRSPENNALGRRKACSRVELHRARRTTPLPPLAPPSSSGANGRSHSGRRGRRCRVRSPEILCLRLLFGSVAGVHGEAYDHRKRKAGSSRGVLAEAIRPAVANGQPCCCDLPEFIHCVLAPVTTLGRKSMPSWSHITNPLRRSRPETPPAGRSNSDWKSQGRARERRPDLLQ